MCFGRWRKTIALNPLDFKSTAKDFEIGLFRWVLEQNQVNQSKSVEILNLSYHRLRGYLRKHDPLFQSRIAS